MTVEESQKSSWFRLKRTNCSNCNFKRKFGRSRNDLFVKVTVSRFQQADHLVTYHPGEQPERLQVLQDVGCLGGDEQHVELLHGLVDVSHGLCLHEGVLLGGLVASGPSSSRGGGRGGHQLGERRQEPLDAGLGHLHELPREERLAGLGANGRGQEYLKGTQRLRETHPTFYSSPNNVFQK